MKRDFCAKNAVHVMFHNSDFRYIYMNYDMFLFFAEDKFNDFSQEYSGKMEKKTFDFRVLLLSFKAISHS